MIITIYLQPFFTQAGVAELVDALDLGSSAFGVGVRVPPSALNKTVIS